jgi:hypothetical protein
MRTLSTVDVVPLRNKTKTKCKKTLPKKTWYLQNYFHQYVPVFFMCQPSYKVILHNNLLPDEKPAEKYPSPSR